MKLEKIFKTTCKQFNVDAGAVLGQNRTAKIVRARDHAVWIAHEVWGYSYPDIARWFNRPTCHPTFIESKNREQARKSDRQGLSDILKKLSTEDKEILSNEIESRILSTLSPLSKGTK